jgi:hypothetical protein
MGEPDPTQFVKKLGLSLTADGRTVGLQFVRENGTVAHLQFKYEDLPNVALHIENAMGKAYDRQVANLKGVDPRRMYQVKPRKVREIQGGTATGGIPVITVVLDTGLRLDLALDQTSLSELIPWLKKLLENSREAAAPKPN